MARKRLGREGFGPGPEGLIVVVLLGIIAAVMIPRFARTRENAYQLQAEEMFTTLAGRLNEYFAENGSYPRVTSMSRLGEALGTDLQRLDRWVWPLKYECWGSSPEDEACTSYALGSTGADLVWEEESLRDYETGENPLTPDGDMVFRDGAFVQRPPGWELSWRESWWSSLTVALAGGLLLIMLCIALFGAGPIGIILELVDRIRTPGRRPWP